MTSEQLRIVTKLSLKIAELGLDANFVPPVQVGPMISAFRFTPMRSTRVRQLESLADDFAVGLELASNQGLDVLVKRMPGDSAVTVFVPNAERRHVDFKDTIGVVWKSPAYTAVPLNFGVDWLGAPFIDDLHRLPHLLIAGSTGSGKSTLLASILATIVYCVDSRTVKLILSDTKAVEFGHFVGAPHLLFDPATNVYETLEHMDWLIDQVDERLKKIGAAGQRNIQEYNATNPPGFSPLPYIVLVIDELADILLHKGEKRGESKLAQAKLGKIVQKSRAAGVYVIAATQRPSVDIVAGSIKNNFPARLTFRLPSETDSRTVIGTSGAEHLLSRGDMLYSSPNRAGLVRLHAPYANINDLKAAIEAASQRERMQNANRI